MDTFSGGGFSDGVSERAATPCGAMASTPSAGCFTANFQARRNAIMAAAPPIHGNHATVLLRGSVISSIESLMMAGPTADVESVNVGACDSSCAAWYSAQLSDATRESCASTIAF